MSAYEHGPKATDPVRLACAGCTARGPYGRGGSAGHAMELGVKVGWFYLPKGAQEQAAICPDCRTRLRVCRGDMDDCPDRAWVLKGTEGEAGWTDEARFVAPYQKDPVARARPWAGDQCPRCLAALRARLDGIVEAREANDPRWVKLHRQFYREPGSDMAAVLAATPVPELVELCAGLYGRALEEQKAADVTSSLLDLAIEAIRAQGGEWRPPPTAHRGPFVAGYPYTGIAQREPFGQFTRAQLAHLVAVSRLKETLRHRAELVTELCAKHPRPWRLKTPGILVDAREAVVVRDETISPDALSASPADLTDTRADRGAMLAAMCEVFNQDYPSLPKEGG